MPASATQIKDLGELEGPVLLFGAPGSNLQATQALLARGRNLAIAPSHRICTGDGLAYCANPVETIAALDGECAWLAGNCEKQLAAGAMDCGCGFEDGSACDLLARGWYAHATTALNQKDRRRLANCPDMLIFRHAARRYAVIHGGWTRINRYLWPDSPSVDFQQEIDAILAQVGPVDGVIAGHCGIAFERRILGINWINAGSIGMPPDDGRTDTRYVILDQGQARIQRLAYDVDGAVRAMRDAGLTQGYHRTLETGIWPSQDILPRSMRR